MKKIKRTEKGEMRKEERRVGKGADQMGFTISVIILRSGITAAGPIALDMLFSELR